MRVQKSLEMGLARDGLSVLVKSQSGSSRLAPSNSSSSLRHEQQLLHMETVPKWFTDTPSSSYSACAIALGPSRNLLLDASAELSAAFAPAPAPALAAHTQPHATSASSTASTCCSLLSHKPVLCYSSPVLDKSSVPCPQQQAASFSTCSALQSSSHDSHFSDMPAFTSPNQKSTYSSLTIDDSSLMKLTSSTSASTTVGASVRPPVCSELILTRNVSVSSGDSEGVGLIDVRTVDEADAMFALAQARQASTSSAGTPASINLQSDPVGPPAPAAAPSSPSRSLPLPAASAPAPATRTGTGTDSASASASEWPAATNEDEEDGDELVGDATLIAIAHEIESQLDADGELELTAAREREAAGSRSSQVLLPELVPAGGAQGQEQNQLAIGPEVIAELGNELCTMLHALGVPWLQSEAEADVECELLDATDLLHGKQIAIVLLRGLLKLNSLDL